MKRLFLIGLLCAAAALTACGSTETEDNDSFEVVTTTTSGTTTTTTTYATTTTKTTTTTKATTTKKATTTEKLAPPPGNDPGKGYGQAFELNGGAVTTRATTRATTKVTTKATTKAADVELKPSVRIDQLFSGLRDRAAEAAEAAKKAQQAQQQAQQDSSNADQSKADESKAEDDKSQDSSSAEPAPEPTPQPAPEKAYPKEYVATSFADFKGYMSYHYQQAIVEKYLAIYPESFFKSKVLALNTVAQAAGRTCELAFRKASCAPGSKVTTIDIDRNELPNAEKVSSTNLIQAAFDRSQYQQYASGGVKWRFTFKKYYKYPLAAAKLDQVGWDLKKAFQASCIKYYRDMPKDADHTTEWYANYAFTNNKGNCYAMAAMFCEMARTLGYKCEQISGKVPLRIGGYGPHSWVEITVGGKVYVCDPDFQAETGLNGYLINYGQKWTWRYEKTKVMS